MKREIKITDKLINGFVNCLIAQEKSISTISAYKRALLSLRINTDDSTISKERLLNYKADISQKYAPSSCNVMIAAINCFLRYIGRTDLFIRPMRIQRDIYESADKELTKKDYDKLIRYAKERGDERTTLAIQTICATGIRVSELQYITVEALCSGQSHIICKGKNRVVFIPKTLCSMLKRYIAKRNIESGAVFVTRNGRPLDRSNLWKSKKRLGEIASIKLSKIYPHNLRHLFARTYYSQQKDISRLADILGHSNINTTRIYTRETGAVHARQIEGLGLIHDTA